MLIELAFFFSFLYDFFNISGYGRIIDIIIFAFLPSYIVINNLGSNRRVIYFREILIWSIIFAISCQSLFSNNNRSLFTLIGLIGGFITYLCLRLIRYIPNLKTIKIIGYLIMSVQLIETILFYTRGINLNIVGYFGNINNRVLNQSLNIFRPSSFYQEPNSLCLALLFIFSLTIIVPKRSLLENKLNNNGITLTKDVVHFMRNNIINNLNFLLLISLSAFVSASLWGISVSIIYLIIIFTAIFSSRNKSNKFKKRIYYLSSFFGLIFFGFQKLLHIQVFKSTYQLLTIRRLRNLETDASAIGRYSLGSIKDKLDAFSLKEFLIGNGAVTSGSRETFQDFVGANGYGFLLYSVGLIGSILFLAAIFIALAKYKNRSIINFLKMYSVIIGFFIIVITTYPFFTYAIFWVWLAICVNCSHFYLERST